jgi:hypothetical protein
MSGLPAVDLSTAFATSTKPAALSGLLPTRPSTKQTSKPTSTAADNPERPKTKRTTASREPGTGRKTSTPTTLRGVIVYVTPEQREWIRSQVNATGRTTTDVVFDAIEAHPAALTTAPTKAAKAGEGRLFTRHPRPEPRDGVQVQLRMTQTDIDTLDKLVRDKTFPSRSAFVRAALSAANS